MRLPSSSKHQLKEFVLIGRMALEEMHRLDEATGAPFDFTNKEVTRKTPARAIWDGLARIGSFMFTKKPWQKAERSTPVDEQTAIAKLRPREAFEIGLERIKEYQYQGTFPMIIIGVATNLSLLGYGLQNGHMDVVSGATLPVILMFNVMAGYAVTKLVERFETIKLVRAGYEKLGESGLDTEITNLGKALKAHEALGWQAKVMARMDKLNKRNHE